MVVFADANLEAQYAAPLAWIVQDLGLHACRVTVRWLRGYPGHDSLLTSEHDQHWRPLSYTLGLRPGLHREYALHCLAHEGRHIWQWHTGTRTTAGQGHLTLDYWGGTLVYRQHRYHAKPWELDADAYADRVTPLLPGPTPTP